MVIFIIFSLLSESKIQKNNHLTHHYNILAMLSSNIKQHNRKGIIFKIIRMTLQENHPYYLQFVRFLTTARRQSILCHFSIKCYTERHMDTYSFIQCTGNYLGRFVRVYMVPIIVGYKIFKFYM